MNVADAKAGDASRCHPLMTAHTPVHATRSMAIVILKFSVVTDSESATESATESADYS